MSESSPPTVVLDASAYRTLAATGDPTAAGAVARHLAAAEWSRGLQAGASPFVLWELLAASVPRPPRPGAPGAGEGSGPARDAVARAALAACVAHCARTDAPAATAALPDADGAAPARTFALALDPDSALCLAVTGAVPAELAAWSEYLASLAGEVAAEPTADRVAQLAGPLRHVRERARQAGEDFADEVQDAIAAAYEAAAPGWDPSATSTERQRSLTDGTAAGGDDELDAGGSLLDAVLAHDPLLRAVALGRARRARRLAAGKSAHAEMFDDTVTPELLADAGTVIERFPAGVGLLRELLRRVIAGELDLATRAGRRWFWDAQVAFAAGGGGNPAGAVVSGNATVLAAAAADPTGAGRAARPMEEHVRRLATPAGGR